MPQRLKVQSMDKLSIKAEMQAFDAKDRDFYDSLTDEERKKFGLFLMIRYGSTVQGSSDMQEWYLRATNERLNVNFFDLHKHPKLQWLLCTTISPGLGAQFHEWISVKKRASEGNKNQKFIRKQFPDLKEDEIALIAQLTSKDQLKQLAKELGYDDRRIKDEF